MIDARDLTALILLLAVFVLLHAAILYGLSRRIGDLEAWRSRYPRDSTQEPTYFLDDSVVDTNCPEIFGGAREPIPITTEETHRLFGETSP